MAPFKTITRLEIAYQPSVHWPNTYSPVIRIVRLAVFEVTGRGKSDEYFAVLSWNEDIAPSTIMGKGASILVLIFAFVT